jgi:hypothetical protein
VEFTDPLSTPHRHDIKAWVIRDNFWYTPLTVQLSTRYQDYIALQMNLESIPTLPYTSKQAAISFETILEWADYENNMSEIDVHLNADYILFISTGPGMPISTGLWANEFNMSIGWSVNLSATASASPWGLIGQILTFSIPDVSPLINLLLGTPIYMTLAFLIAAIISRFVPTVGGL